MFHSSSQRQHWMFKNEAEVEKRRQRATKSFIEKQTKSGPFLDTSEELQLVQYYQKKLVEVCNLFSPPSWAPLPRTALATALMYFKRFYLDTSVMEYHPQDIYLSCAFLAFKIDEYNVTLEQFINTLSPFFPSQKLEYISNFILSHELYLLQNLKFHLTVHSPFRPLNGFIIDIKTRTPDLPNPDQFRKEADKFLVLSLCSDVGLLFPPSQIALAALWHSAKKTQNHIDGYLLSVLFNSESSSTVQSITDCLQRVESIVMATVLPDRASISSIDEKLSNFLALASKSRKRKSEGLPPSQGHKKHKASGDDDEESPLSSNNMSGITALSP